MWVRLGLAQARPRAARLREAPALESLELLGHGPLDDHGEIAVGYLRAHESPKPLQLVVELGACGELHLVARVAERLDDRGLEAWAVRAPASQAGRPACG